VDRLVSEVLAGAEGAGAATEKVYLLDRRIEFCTNCRTCTQEPGDPPGRCVHDDDMRGILDLIEGADALVLAAPVNFYNVNALFRRFMERLVCFAYWPWDTRGAPGLRRKKAAKRAVLVTSAAMPGLLIPYATGAVRALKGAAKVLGARPSATVCVGFMGEKPQPVLPEKALARARAAGRNLCR
jgi:hypothetical protein